MPDDAKKGRQMRKALIVVLILVVAAGGYLGWDWYAKTKKKPKK
jgi:predicted negative regulator of RcsB-dependent stress response